MKKEVTDLNALQEDKETNTKIIVVRIPLKEEPVIRELPEKELPEWAKQKLQISSENTESEKAAQGKLSEQIKKAVNEEVDQELILKIELELDDNGKVISTSILEQKIKEIKNRRNINGTAKQK